MNRARPLLIVQLILALSMPACATNVVQFGDLAPWTERQFKTTLPEPFGSVRLTIVSDRSGTLEAFTIATDVGEVALPKEILAQLHDVSTPEITYIRAEAESDPALEKFSVHVEFGDYVYSKRFKDSFQNIAGWSVDRGMRIGDFEIVDYQ